MTTNQIRWGKFTTDGNGNTYAGLPLDTEITTKDENDNGAVTNYETGFDENDLKNNMVILNQLGDLWLINFNISCSKYNFKSS